MNRKLRIALALTIFCVGLAWLLFWMVGAGDYAKVNGVMSQGFVWVVGVSLIGLIPCGLGIWLIWNLDQ